MDRREQNHRWYTSFDSRRMVFLIDDGAADEPDETDPNTLIIPAKYDVCGTCDGKGTHVNPSIDAHGLSREDFDNDPDFAEDYFSGHYDVPCNECGGTRVSPTLDESRCTPELLQAAHTLIDAHYAEQAEDYNARRYGY